MFEFTAPGILYPIKTHRAKLSAIVKKINSDDVGHSIKKLKR
jgi:hypothetical protein